MNPKANTMLLPLCLGLAGIACAANNQALVEDVEAARVAYTRAAAGSAARINPAKLDEARRALDAAQSPSKNLWTDERRTWAYVALRKAETAEAASAAILAAEARNQADNELAELERRDGASQRSATAIVPEDPASGVPVPEPASPDVANPSAPSAAPPVAAIEPDVAPKENGAALGTESASEQASDPLSRLGRDADVVRDSRGLVIAFADNKLFPAGQSTLWPEADARLTAVADVIKTTLSSNGAVVVEAHVVPRDLAGIGARLAEERATAVRTHLVARGVDPARVFARAAAESPTVQGIGPRPEGGMGSWVTIVVPEGAGAP